MSGHMTYGEYKRSRDGFDRADRPHKRQRIAPPREDNMVEKRRRRDHSDEREPNSSLFRPSMLNFKSFLLTQDDSITDDEAMTKFQEYKLEFHRQQLNEFFVAHKEEQWFREKYEPDQQAARRSLALASVKERLSAFMDLYNQGLMKELRLEADRAEDIAVLLDCFVFRLKGGSQDKLEQLLGGEELEPEEQLHKTSSLHLRTLHPHVKREELETVCAKYPGYVRLCISDPAPDNKWFRKAWVSFTRDTKIKETCYSLSSVRLKECELSPVLNKDLSRRIRSQSTLTNDKSVVRSDIKSAIQLIQLLDKKWELWASTVDEILGEQSANPLLQNITEHLIEEMSAEEDELLGCSGSQQQLPEKAVEVDAELSSVLDKLVLYLRLVHSVDYYNTSLYQMEDEMPNRCGIFHVRDTPPDETETVKEQDILNFKEEFSKKMQKLMHSWAVLSDEDIQKLGAKDETEAVEIFIQANTEDLGNDKFLCPLSGKKFKGADFVRKHILNKHEDKVNYVKKDVAFFNNYIRDARRPTLPEKPKPVQQQQRPKSPKPRERSRSPPQPRERAEERPRGSVKDRLGYRNQGPAPTRVTQAVADPRGIVDYSDVDFADDIF